MKAAKVLAKNIFPHNLRHLFVRTHYAKFKDIVRLADILGHSSTETLRIYTARSGQEERRQFHFRDLSAAVSSVFQFSGLMDRAMVPSGITSVLSSVLSSQ